MIESIIGSALTTLIAQGSGWIIAVLLGLYAYLLDKRVTQTRDAANKQNELANAAVRDQYEKRLAEFREILDVMANSTNTVKGMHGSLTATTEAINQLAIGFSKLLSEFQSQQVRWDDKGGNMAKQLDDIRQRVESLQREVRAA